MTPENDSLRAELAALRRQVRAQLILLVGALALAAVSFVQTIQFRRDETPAEAYPGVLAGTSLYLRDDPEQPYVRLKFLQEGAGLLLSDIQGRSQVQLCALDGHGRLMLGTAPSRLELDSNPAGPALTLRDASGRPRILLTAGEAAQVSLLGPDGRPRLELSAGGEGAITIRDATGRVVRRLP